MARLLRLATGLPNPCHWCAVTAQSYTIGMDQRQHQQRDSQEHGTGSRTLSGFMAHMRTGPEEHQQTPINESTNDNLHLSLVIIPSGTTASAPV